MYEVHTVRPSMLHQKGGRAVFPLMKEGFRVCHPLLARGDCASATLNHQNWTRAILPFLMTPGGHRGRVGNMGEPVHAPDGADPPGAARTPHGGWAYPLVGGIIRRDPVLEGHPSEATPWPPSLAPHLRVRAPAAALEPAGEAIHPCHGRQCWETWGVPTLSQRASPQNLILGPGSSRAHPSRPRKKGGRGVDTHNQVKGRKWHILVETLGMILTVVVTAARVQDRDGALQLLDVLRDKFCRRRLIWADQAYAGDLMGWMWALWPWRKVRREIVKRPEGTKGFQLLPKRWKVERTFGWFGRYRCLSKDYEYLTQSSEAMIRAAMIHLMVRRLARMVPS
jgi:transposase